MKHLITLMLLTIFATANAQDSITATTIHLGDVEVIGIRNSQRLSKGGVITDVRGTPLSNAGTCLDVITQLPGVRPNGDNIEVSGRGTPQIYINGRLLVDKSELDRISSKEIQNVEVVFNPGARYGAETKSVILIKTIRKQGDGMSTSLQSTMRQARYTSMSENVFANYRTGGFYVFGSFNHDYARRYQKQINTTHISTPADRYLVSSGILIYPKSNTYHTNIGINWQINKSHYLGAKYEYSATPHSKSHWATNEVARLNNSLDDSISYSTDWKRKSAPVHLANLYYHGSINNLKVTVNNDYYFQRNHNRQSIIQSGTTGDQRIIESNNKIKSSMFASKGVAEYSFHKNTIEFGYEVTATDRRDIFVNENANLPTSDDRIKETTAAAFIAANIPINKTELYIGMRYEHTNSDYYQNGSLVHEQSRRYRRLYPNVDFTFQIGRARFTLSYEAKTKRPLYSQLSSSIQYDDRFTYETGNPLLKPEQIHSISLAGIYRWIFFSASYTCDKDAIISVIDPYISGEPQNIMTYNNFNHLSKYNIVVSLSPRISRWSPRIRLNLMGQHFSINSLGATKHLDKPILHVKVYNSISLGNGFTLSGDIMARTQGDTDVVTLKPSWQINLGLAKNMKNWFIQLQATDIFKTARNSMITHGTQMTLDKWNYSDTQALRLIARYSINTAVSKYKGKGAGNDERGRL